MQGQWFFCCHRPTGLVRDPFGGCVPFPFVEVASTPALLMPVPLDWIAFLSCSSSSWFPSMRICAFVDGSRSFKQGEGCPGMSFVVFHPILRPWDVHRGWASSSPSPRGIPSTFVRPHEVHSTPRDHRKCGPLVSTTAPKRPPVEDPNRWSVRRSRRWSEERAWIGTGAKDQDPWTRGRKKKDEPRAWESNREKKNGA